MELKMELRHLRYFLAVGEALNLSRQVQDLEDELGVDLLRRSPRGVTLEHISIKLHDSTEG